MESQAESLNAVKSDPKSEGAAAKKNKVLVAILQLKGVTDKAANIEAAKIAMEEAAATGAKILILPEIWPIAHNKELYPTAAENPNWSAAKTPALELMKSQAQKHKVYVIGGSIVEVDDSDGNDRYYNTCFVFDPKGEIVAKYRKIHLFDVDIPGKMTHKESETVGAGNEITMFDTEYGRIGVSICYDIRFTEQFLLMAREGAKIIVCPAAFSLTTGEAHWEVLLRARALDTQCYVIGAACARYVEEPKLYQSWGHSTVVDPWGKVVITTEHGPATLYAELDLSYVDQVREQLPYSKQKRGDIYQLTRHK
jgi:omega-amidase